MKAGFLGTTAVFAAMALAFLACGDDDATPAGGSTSSGGTSGTSSGGTSSGGTSSGGTSSGNPPPAEPTCSASPTATPTWTFKDKPIPGWDAKHDDIFHSRILGIAGLAYGNGTWVAIAGSVGGIGGEAGKSDVTWAISTDGTTWTTKSMAPTEGTQHSTLGAGPTGGAILFDGKRFVFFGGSEKGTFMYTSPDGQSFTGVKMSDQGLPIGKTASNGDSTIVTAGSNGNLWVTTDLKTFKQATVNLSPGPGGYNDIAFGNGRFVVADEPHRITPLSSADGITWDTITGGAIFNSNVSFGGGAFHAPANPKFWKSTDGVAWSEETRSGTSGLATDGGKTFYLAGRWLLQRVSGKVEGLFATSADGAAWSDYGVSTGGLATAPLHGGAPLGIAYGGCHYISYGTYWGGDDVVAPWMMIADVSPAK